MTTVSLIIVNWHASHLVRRAIASARSASTIPLEVIVVDNSCDAGEASRLRTTGADRVLISDRNDGYGAGMNRGAAVATGEWLILSNPDVVFRTGAIDALLTTLADGAAVTGPRFVWDDEGRWLLPPADDVTLRARLGAVLATRNATAFRLRDRLRARNRMDFWTQTRPTRMASLSGAVLAMRRSRFAALRGFDERFHLYFEETDLLRRIQRTGGAAVHVPDAVVRHLYNQSGAQRPDREAVYLESEARFFRKWYGSDLLPRLARPLEAPADAAAGTVFAHPDAVWIEASPEPHFLSAAGAMAVPSLELSRGVVESLEGRPLWIRAVDARGGELTRWCFTAPGAPSA